MHSANRPAMRILQYVVDGKACLPAQWRAGIAGMQD